ncbi:MAG: ectoine hydrolase DoeA [Rhodobacteraceae bacterium]|nr:ectoine hydrolase DoeA [Paracoccaceae bacterium]MAY46190.1 ectoine hydrolase DoeA [Paracoccaceae bacterium]QEW22729.1 Creatinase [Marinibacterium anthonyi]
MPSPDLPFERSEYATRLAKTRTAMAEAGINVLIVTDPSNMAWLTGYDGWSFYVHQAVVVFPDGDPLWWGRRQDAAGAVRTVWMDDDHVTSYAEDYIQTPLRHPMQDLASRIIDHGHGKAWIGVEMDNYYFSAKAYTTLVEFLPDATITDATALVNWQRAVKSPAEIAFIRQAARISEKLIDGLSERVEPGVPKNEVVAETFRDAINGVEGAWGDYPAIVPLLPSGPAAAAPHLTWDGEPFRKGEGTTFEIAGCYRRYHAPFCRTMFLGTPPDEMLRAADALAAGLEAGLDAARAGNRCRDIADAMNGELAKVGIIRAARCGYPIGLSYPPDWGERTMSIRSEDETELQAGMTFHFMPGLWMENWGLSITESILIREDGRAETFCDRPRELFIKA